MPKCLVTGGAGFIGSHLVDQLIEDGHEVVVIDNFLLGREENLNDEAEFHQKDIIDYYDIKPHFEDVDVVFHVAADPRLPVSIEDPIHTHEVNVTGTVNVLTASKEHDVEKVVFSSSASVYGDQEELPISEDAETKPKAPYAMHKLMGEQYMRVYSDLYGLDTISLRYFNVYGPRKTTKGGYPMVIPIFLKQRTEGKPLTIVGDGEQTRDYVHVKDVVSANISAWKSDNGGGDVFNVGTNTQVSVNEIAEIIGGETKNIPEREGEIRFAEADISKIKKELGWEPKVDFEQGLRDLKDYWGVK